MLNPARPGRTRFRLTFMLSSSLPSTSGPSRCFSDAPENTRGGETRVVQHADAVETDIHLTKDGRLIVSHDKITKRTTARRDDSGSDLDELRTWTREVEGAAIFRRETPDAR